MTEHAAAIPLAVWQDPQGNLRVMICDGGAVVNFDCWTDEREEAEYIDTSNHRDNIIAGRNAGKAGIDPPQASEFVSEQHCTWVQSMLTPHPIGVYLQPIHLTGARERIEHKIYLRTTVYGSKRFDACREMARQNGWHVQDISCAHDMMIDEPQFLAHTLSAIAATPRAA